jgi:hypothetical protein
MLHTSFDALQHCLNQLEAPTMERVPHGDVPFWVPQNPGGPRLRYVARPWIIMMASSVHHADNAERNDTLKWSIDEVSLCLS